MKLIMTVGLPRSGKSTWARKQGVPVVSLDAIRLSLHGLPHLESAEPKVIWLAKMMIASLFNAGHKKVILDATSVSNAVRKTWVKLYGKSNVQFKVFYTSPDVCIRRAYRTGKDYLIPVIHKMNLESDIDRYFPKKEKRG